LCAAAISASIISRRANAAVIGSGSRSHEGCRGCGLVIAGTLQAGLRPERRRAAETATGGWGRGRSCLTTGLGDGGAGAVGGGAKFAENGQHALAAYVVLLPLDGIAKPFADIVQPLQRLKQLGCGCD
jgi:hypothetical protein